MSLPMSSCVCASTPLGVTGSYASYKTRPISPGDFEFGAILGSLWIFHTHSVAVTTGFFYAFGFCFILRKTFGEVLIA